MKLTINPNSKFGKSAKAVLAYAGMLISFFALYLASYLLYFYVYAGEEYVYYIHLGITCVLGCALMTFFILLKGRNASGIKLAVLAAICLILAAGIRLAFQFVLYLNGGAAEILVYYFGTIIGRNTNLLSPKNAALT